jgi:hypothetical protein
MHIKNGKVIHNSSLNKKPAPLVPYDEDEESEEEERKIDVNTTTEVPGAYGPLLKKEKLTVNTSFNHSINATTKWQVAAGENLQSPCGSGSSNSSSHSTTEWQVSSTKEPGAPVLPEAQHHGWTITEKSSPFNGLLDKVKKSDDDSPMFSPSTRSPSPGDRIDIAPLIRDEDDEEEKSHKKKKDKKKKKKKHKKKREDREEGEISDSPPPSKKSSPQQPEPPVNHDKGSVASFSHCDISLW